MWPHSKMTQGKITTTRLPARSKKSLPPKPSDGGASFRGKAALVQTREAVLQVRSRAGSWMGRRGLLDGEAAREQELEEGRERGGAPPGDGAVDPRDGDEGGGPPGEIQGTARSSRRACFCWTCYCVVSRLTQCDVCLCFLSY